MESTLSTSLVVIHRSHSVQMATADQLVSPLRPPHTRSCQRGIPELDSYHIGNKLPAPRNAICPPKRNVVIPPGK